MDPGPGALVALTLAAIWGAVRTWAELVKPAAPEPWIRRPDEAEGNA